MAIPSPPQTQAGLRVEGPAPSHHSYNLVSVSCPPAMQKQATVVPTLLPSTPSIWPLQARALYPLSRNRQAWLLMRVLKSGRVESMVQGREGAEWGPGVAYSRPSPAISSKAWRQWWRGGGVHACTLYPVSRPHNAQAAGGAGSQGPLMPVPSGSPCRASRAS